MELQEALAQITEIRLQLARTEVFRGFRAVPVAFSGLVAFGAAFLQAVYVPDPTRNIMSYLAIWVGAAIVSIVACGAEMLMRCWSSPDNLTRETTWLAVEQFLPCLTAGSLTTIALLAFAPDSTWMLPGLWSVFFSLGVFASYRLLPRATFWVGVHYLTAGLACLALARGTEALSPWAMALSFGVGQWLAAGVLYWTLERSDG